MGVILLLRWLDTLDFGCGAPRANDDGGGAPPRQRFRKKDFGDSGWTLTLEHHSRTPLLSQSRAFHFEGVLGLTTVLFRGPAKLGCHDLRSVTYLAPSLLHKIIEMIHRLTKASLHIYNYRTNGWPGGVRTCRISGLCERRVPRTPVLANYQSTKGAFYIWLPDPPAQRISGPDTCAFSYFGGWTRLTSAAELLARTTAAEALLLGSASEKKKNFGGSGRTLTLEILARSPLLNSIMGFSILRGGSSQFFCFAVERSRGATICDL